MLQINLNLVTFRDVGRTGQNNFCASYPRRVEIQVNRKSLPQVQGQFCGETGEYSAAQEAWSLQGLGLSSFWGLPQRECTALLCLPKLQPKVQGEMAWTSFLVGKMLDLSTEHNECMTNVRP